MARCEDWPCCGHEAGDCPRIDADGNEIWKCASCSKELPKHYHSSLCDRCLRKVEREDDYCNDSGE